MMTSLSYAFCDLMHVHVWLCMYIAVLLENFSIFYNEDDTNLTHAVVMDFQHNWLFYDKNASVRM